LSTNTENYPIMNRKAIPALIIGSGVLLTLAISPLLIASATDQQARIDRARGLQQDLGQSQLEHSEVVENAAELARQRFEAGCLVIVDLETNTYVAITEGSKVVDRLNRRALPANVPVCDYLGGTAQTDSNGVLINYAFLGDREIVQAHIQGSGVMLAGADTDALPTGQHLGGDE
jgi:hypothetical protein